MLTSIYNYIQRDTISVDAPRASAAQSAWNARLRLPPSRGHRF